MTLQGEIYYVDANHYYELCFVASTLLHHQRRHTDKENIDLYDLSLHEGDIKTTFQQAKHWAAFEYSGTSTLGHASPLRGHFAWSWLAQRTYNLCSYHLY